MTSFQRCMEVLDNHRIRYTDAGHANANRAREVAAAEHVPPYRLAKTVVFCGRHLLRNGRASADCRSDLDSLTPNPV
jgi:prolyl-tRNA editing enzyme YbaK/EbsC (Cys-tRNA(Pro) deacylase)